jgi:hypothetical protein
MRPSVVLNLESRAVGAAATMARVACPPRPCRTGSSFNDGARRDRGRDRGRGASMERVHTRTRPVSARKGRAACRGPRPKTKQQDLLFSITRTMWTKNGRTWKRDHTRATATRLRTPFTSASRENRLPHNSFAYEHGRWEMHYLGKVNCCCT